MLPSRCVISQLTNSAEHKCLTRRLTNIWSYCSVFCYVFNLENRLNILCSNQPYLTCLFLFRICMNPPCLTLQAPFFAITTINQWQFLDDTMLFYLRSPSGGCVEPWAPGRGVVTWQLFESVNSWGNLTRKKLDGSRLWFFHVAHVNCEDEDSNHSIEIAVRLFHIAMNYINGP